eukprot:m.12147 g.12147  ORF g.12147 m.12147 type:complete len:338 (+) comp3958_c0_seq1:29-1042(+)
MEGEDTTSTAHILSRVEAAIQEHLTLSQEEEDGDNVDDLGLTDTDAYNNPYGEYTEEKKFDVDAFLRQASKPKKRPTTTAKKSSTSSTSTKLTRAKTATTGTRQKSPSLTTTSGISEETQAKLFKDDALLDAVDKGDVVGDAAIRILKAKLAVIMEQSEIYRMEAEDLRKNQQKLKAESKSFSKDSLKEKKEAASLQKELLQTKRKLSDAVSKLEKEKERVTLLQSDVAALKKETNQDTHATDALSVRLNRALEERDALKQKLKSQALQTSASSGAEVKSLQSKCKQLTIQRDEVLAAFEKALKLVDVLKKQKVHMEAAKQLAFTEEEFARTLDWKE